MGPSTLSMGAELLWLPGGELTPLVLQTWNGLGLAPASQRLVPPLPSGAVEQLCGTPAHTHPATCWFPLEYRKPVHSPVLWALAYAGTWGGVYVFSARVLYLS